MVVNHMVGAGGTGTGSGGSYFDADKLEFPGVPFGPNDFNCCYCSDCSSGSCGIESYSDKNQVDFHFQGVLFLTYDMQGE